MRIKRIILFVFLLFGLNSVLWAQQPQQNDERRKAEFEAFKAKRVAYITQEMGLTTEESQAFWPLCNELQEKKFELNKELRKAFRDLSRAERSGQKPSDADYKKVVDLGADVKVKEAQLEKEYYTRFEKVISSEKILKYQRAEQLFARKMLEERDSRDNRDNPRRGGPEGSGRQ